MCLVVSKKNINRSFKKPSKPLIGFKVVTKNESTGVISSWFNTFSWKLGKNVSDRKSITFLGKQMEREHLVVNFGFHFYSDIEDALEYCGITPFSYHSNFTKLLLILVCKISPKYFVASGRSNLFDCEVRQDNSSYKGPPSFVASECDVIGVINELENVDCVKAKVKQILKTNK